MAHPQDGTNSNDGNPNLSLDAILDLLAHHHRRALLRKLRAASDTVAEDELLGHVQEQEKARTGVLPSWDHISATLHHVHEPKLSEAGVLSYYEGKETYEYHPNERLEQWLDHIDEVHGEGA